MCELGDGGGKLGLKAVFKNNRVHLNPMLARAPEVFENCALWVFFAAKRDEMYWHLFAFCILVRRNLNGAVETRVSRDSSPTAYRTYKLALSPCYDADNRALGAGKQAFQLNLHRVAV